ncbi:unnamed protein product [Cladocopium goreaui]|uniref:Uncharacterized protein n=1 Tax=Cladocopium goreaui TaxID=2562237 RepID=A0A9P1G9P4_9DINO|nr:unnamed protein product [Cladocopium goreaui]
MSQQDMELDTTDKFQPLAKTRCKKCVFSLRQKIDQQMSKRLLGTLPQSKFFRNAEGGRVRPPRLRQAAAQAALGAALGAADNPREVREVDVDRLQDACLDGCHRCGCWGRKKYFHIPKVVFLAFYIYFLEHFVSAKEPNPTIRADPTDPMKRDFAAAEIAKLEEEQAEVVGGMAQKFTTEAHKHPIDSAQREDLEKEALWLQQWERQAKAEAHDLHERNLKDFVKAFADAAAEGRDQEAFEKMILKPPDDGKDPKEILEEESWSPGDREVAQLMKTDAGAGDDELKATRDQSEVRAKLRVR